MYKKLGAWALAICSVLLLPAPGGAMKWTNEEQFVDGEFPYYPFSSKLYSLSDGLTDDEALANEFSAVNVDKKIETKAQKATEFPTGRKRSLVGGLHKSAFYEFKNDSDTVIDATKYETNEGSKKSSSKIGRLVLKNAKASSKKSKIDVPRSIRSGLTDGSKPEIQIGFEEQKTEFLENGLNPRPSDLSEGVLQKLSGPLTVEGKSNVVQSHNDALESLMGFKCENHNSKSAHPPVKINPPYENNFSGGGFRYTNPSTWLAREIEKFIRRKDYRWLDFMKNNGLETNGVLVETKHQPEEIRRIQKNRVIGCLKQNDKTVDKGPSEGKDKAGRPQQTLLHQIDALLEDLSQFRASVKHDKLSDKKQRDVGPKNQKRSIRETRSATQTSGHGKSEAQKPIVNHPRVTSSLVLDDLKDLKKNIVLYENNLIDDENRQALEDLRLHIKVYVENGEKAVEEK